MIVRFAVCFRATSEQLTAVKLLMKSESASETGWWLKMVINAACFILSSGLLLHAICRCLIATLHHSDRHTHFDSSSLPDACLLPHKETVIYLRFSSFLPVVYISHCKLEDWVKEGRAASDRKLDRAGLRNTRYTHRNTHDSLFSLNHDHFLFGRNWEFFVHEKSKKQEVEEVRRRT